VRCTGRENLYHDSAQSGEKTHITTWRNAYSITFCLIQLSFLVLVFQSTLSVIYFSKSRSKIQEQIKIMSEIYLAYSVIFTRQDLRSNRHVLQLHMDLEKNKTNNNITIYKNNVYGLGRVISILLLFYCLAYPLYHVRHTERAGN
jgi:hypothetical protein